MAENDVISAADSLAVPPATRPMRVGAVIQARVRSTRLPGKALLPLPLGGDVTLFEQVLTRARRAKLVDEVVVALPDSAADLPLFHLAQRAGVRTVRGSEEDVLSRFYIAATTFDYETIVRLTADNPALDPQFIDAAVRAHLDADADYSITTGLPLGMNIEVISRAALIRAHYEATAAPDREHVTLYVHQRPEQFRLLTIPLAHATPEAVQLRLTVDYPTDYALLHLLYSGLGADFGLNEVVSFVRLHPLLASLNATNEQVRV